MVQQQRCAHSGCTCLAPQEDPYWSDHCREHGEHEGMPGEHVCECGHAECVAVVS